MDPDGAEFAFLLKFFNHGKSENPRYFRRLGNPGIAGCDILEVGCGTGSLAIYMAKELGAGYVLATDIERDNIAFAQTHLACHFPELAGRVEFRPVNISDLPPDRKFDCVVAKDMFEHVLDFQAFFDSVCARLKPGGRLLSGFGPLWESPRGGHALTVFPLDHLFLPERTLVARHNRRHGLQVSSIREYGLNRLKLGDYLRVFARSGLRQDYFRLNQSDSALGKLAAATLLKLPFFRRLSFNAYLVFSKPA